MSKSAEKQGLLEETWSLLLPCNFPPGQTRRKVLSKPELPGLTLEQSVPITDLQMLLQVQLPAECPKSTWKPSALHLTQSSTCQWDSTGVFMAYRLVIFHCQKIHWLHTSVPSLYLSRYLVQSSKHIRSSRFCCFSIMLQQLIKYVAQRQTAQQRLLLTNWLCFLVKFGSPRCVPWHSSYFIKVNWVS